MAASPFIHSSHINCSSHGISKIRNPLEGGFYNPKGFSSFQNNHRNMRTHIVKATSDGRKQVELVYNLDEKLNRLADDVDMNAGLSRLTLFSPCKIALSTNVPGIPLDERNLIIKALNLYRKKTGSDKFFWVHVDKRVPTGAGLGGGSSNAATALWAANQFSGCLATEKELQEWSGEIGSDVPFFFSNGAAYCTGRGEHFRLDASSTVDPLTLLEKISKNGISQDVCVNDLEPPAFEVLPSLKRLKQRVVAAGRGKYDAVFMSGSGSTIVGVGSPDPPHFIYDEEEYKDVFLSEANFVTRADQQWYTEPSSSNASSLADHSSGTA
ncbi:hypothetical protein L1987_45740 [Smallanthus sonchifolius]|uniref:Uncharacterized protein n=1 Tax=Smallanthus sonchifolius TaxID=185202 RepID=A0ACB9FXZ1_9ASTR|nr:hypothetical protein L1987_45740 [Smallanthus sonchifolius]